MIPSNHIKRAGASGPGAFRGMDHGGSILPWPRARPCQTTGRDRCPERSAAKRVAMGLSLMGRACPSARILPVALTSNFSPIRNMAVPFEFSEPEISHAETRRSRRRFWVPSVLPISPILPQVSVPSALRVIPHMERAARATRVPPGCPAGRLSRRARLYHGPDKSFVALVGPVAELTVSHGG